MKKLAYLDCPTGIAGDMCLGALVDAGAPLTYLIETLQRLGIGDEYELQAEGVRRNGQAATKIQVHLLTLRTKLDHPHSPTRHLPEIERLILGAELPAQGDSLEFGRLPSIGGSRGGRPWHFP